MPLVYDSVFAAVLARELDACWSGLRLEAVRFDGEARTVALAFADEAWAWLLHPAEGVLASLPSRRARRRRDRGVISGRRLVTGVESPRDTRSVLVRLEGGDAPETLVFDLVTNRWNALLVVDGRVRSVLNSRLGRDPVAPGDSWQPPGSDRRWAEAVPTAGEWQEMVDETADPDERAGRRRVAWISRPNEAFVFGDTADGAGSLGRYLELRSIALNDPPSGWLLARDRDDTEAVPYVAALGNPGAKPAGSVLEALATWAAGSERIARSILSAGEDPEVAELRAALEDRRERAAKKIRSLEAEVESARDPEQLRQLGHLLLARKASIRTGTREIELEDFAGGTVNVELDPTLDAIGNAEVYYDRARRLERAAAKLPGRIATGRRRLDKLDRALERLDAEGPSEALWKLTGRKARPAPRGGPSRSGAAVKRTAVLPYRVYRTSSGLEIRAGRSARDNDELTFRHSAPDDIWMHVRESPGSHVVLRWGKRDQNPSAGEIAEAAQVAALLSRARGSKVVPVSWTRRKYVRKPRKAPPGTVTVERAQTVFVEPDAALVEAMAEEV